MGGLVMRLFSLAAAAVAFVSAPAMATDTPIQVMVVGTWHFANHNRDLINVESEDVRSPRRQAELERLTEVLAEFQPTKIMVERVAPDPDLIDPGYAVFTPATLMERRDETAQLGYRLAYRLGHRKVYAIDEQPKLGGAEYFPFGPVAEFDRTRGRGDLMERVQTRGSAMMKDFAEKQKTMSIAALLAEGNEPGFGGGISPYYELLSVGNGEAQPGAELNAMYYMRNAKIFTKLASLAEPGDRILVVYGAGHNYWLRHFASQTPGYINIDPIPFLLRAAAE
jgi:hypothetical protein